ncbi:hypothetical protein KKE92_00005, partial [Candidatus Micrarchaeota archaeon]|nr:hypothetical protein [Candidatus Micrarchaeota archaeon]
MLDARCSRRDIHRFRARAFSFITKTPAAVLRKKKTLAEGLQIAVPTDSAGRRMWSRMSDEEVVEYARKVMRENKINTRGELQKADSGLHGILKRRGLLGKIKFEEKQKSWKG